MLPRRLPSAFDRHCHPRRCVQVVQQHATRLTSTCRSSQQVSFWPSDPGPAHCRRVCCVGAAIGPSGPRLPDPYLHLGLSLFSRRRADPGRRSQQWQWQLRSYDGCPVIGFALVRYRIRGRAGRGCCAKWYPRVVTATGRGGPRRLRPWLVMELEAREGSERRSSWVRWEDEG